MDAEGGAQSKGAKKRAAAAKSKAPDKAATAQLKALGNGQQGAVSNREKKKLAAQKRDALALTNGGVGDSKGKGKGDPKGKGKGKKELHTKMPDGKLICFNYNRGHVRPGGLHFRAQVPDLLRRSSQTSLRPELIAGQRPTLQTMPERRAEAERRCTRFCIA